MKKKILYVGLDVHKKTSDVAIAPGRSNGKVRFYGKIDSTVDALNKLIKKLEEGDKQLRFVYEAGPCGYQIYRHLDAKGSLKGMDTHYIKPSEESLTAAMDKYTTWLDAQIEAKLQNVDHSVAKRHFRVEANF